ncbi:uncharacterized protein HMPREF1541_08524 [Cyphellophora europaea CBS 101466]|uniref:Sin3 binding protein n=1 Tax=Cyphellophora europaea (strain CBS 101466) TaxID=1220924 RepID=W2RIA3_CYPE1|nr:uncharacterized protein HMPREF1541_08524 [Cyphellophora europaea CBS 101466]ETN36247.1 hypothetical protein HMPREF1541_08524 [Cyphellophora europaea CBS 101466]
MAPRAVSALGMALNGKSASVDIPKPRENLAARDNFTAVPARKQRGDMLPTPPHSISPNLPPTNRRPSDSDVELKDAPAEASALNAEALDRLGDLDAVGAITPGLLAKHHLPDILLAHGPLAIRHIMGYLTTSVPGFSRITSAKARRLVVAALEGRGSGADGAGLNGDVIFDKVGWGRWDARLKGQPPRDRASNTITPPGSLPNSYSHSLNVPGQRSQHSGSEAFGTSFTGNSGVFSHSEAEYDDQDMLEHEADKMSLDGNEDGYASSSPGEDIDIDLGEGDVTEDEDWQSIGAEALRARSLPKGGQIRKPSGGSRIYQPIASYSIASYSSARHRSRTPALAQSAPTKARPVHNLPRDAGVNSSSEQAAIEALLSLGSA